MDYNITYREKDKGWQVIVSYKDINGKWRQKSKQGFKLQRDAKPYVDKLLEEIRVSASSNKEFSGITFKEFTDLHMNHLKISLSQSTVNVYSIAFKKFDSLDNMELTKIKPIHIQNIVDKLIDTISQSTLRIYLNKINSTFNVAINQYNIIATSPVKNIKYKSNKDTNDKTALTISESNDLLSKINNENLYLTSLLAVKCGLRLGEILGLTWGDIDYDNKTININKQWKLVSKNSYGFGSPKSKNSNRIVPMPDIVCTALKACKIRSIDGRIIPYKNTTAISSSLKRIYEKVGFNISVHELRHTYATSLVSAGIDFKTIAKLMGHDIEQTMKTYSHVTDEMFNNASNLIRNIL